jgi:hypothetical protein
MHSGEKVRVVILRAVNPKSVVCEESILFNALTTLGVPEPSEPGMGYADFREVAPDGTVHRVLRWTLLDASADGRYQTQDLIKWWRDPVWLAANPTHELAILKVGLENMLRLAERIAKTPYTQVLRKGRRQLHLPANLSPEKRTAALAAFEGAAA